MDHRGFLTHMPSTESMSSTTWPARHQMTSDDIRWRRMTMASPHGDPELLSCRQWCVVTMLCLACALKVVLKCFEVFKKVFSWSIWWTQTSWAISCSFSNWWTQQSWSTDGGWHHEWNIGVLSTARLSFRNNVWVSNWDKYTGMAERQSIGLILYLVVYSEFMYFCISVFIFFRFIFAMLWCFLPDNWTR